MLTCFKKQGQRTSDAQTMLIVGSVPDVKRHSTFQDSVRSQFSTVIPVILSISESSETRIKPCVIAVAAISISASCTGVPLSLKVECISDALSKISILSNYKTLNLLHNPLNSANCLVAFIASSPLLTS